jgi:hypothetical protein
LKENDTFFLQNEHDVWWLFETNSWIWSGGSAGVIDSIISNCSNVSTLFSCTSILVIMAEAGRLFGRIINGFEIGRRIIDMAVAGRASGKDLDVVAADINSSKKLDDALDKELELVGREMILEVPFEIMENTVDVEKVEVGLAESKTDSSSPDPSITSSISSLDDVSPMKFSNDRPDCVFKNIGFVLSSDI